jgi:two-component system nitrate/nitrite response regulator NarL
MPSALEPRVLIIAETLLARTGLAAMLGQQPALDVVGQVAGGPSLMKDLTVYRPDVIVIDLGYEPAELLTVLAALVESNLPLVALLPDAQSATIVMHTLALAAAYAILLREGELDLITAAVEAVAAGLVVMDPTLVMSLLPVNENVAPLDDYVDASALTPREDEVLRLLARGMTNRAIAHALEISPNTVKFHVNAILSKLNAQSRTEAVVRATRLGLLSL